MCGWCEVVDIFLIFSHPTQCPTPLANPATPPHHHKPRQDIWLKHYKRFKQTVAWCWYTCANSPLQADLIRPFSQLCHYMDSRYNRKTSGCVEQLIVSDRVCLRSLVSHESAARVWYDAPQPKRYDKISWSTWVWFYFYHSLHLNGHS